jgi:hypothetical protein
MATTTPPAGDAGYRSLADQLRGWPDERLARLLLARPDLVTPAPHDFGQLASRAAVRASLSRALDALTRLELSVLDALVVAGQTSRADAVAMVHAAPGAVEAALDLLVERALVWSSVGGWRAVTGVADALGTGPGSSGLRPRSPEPATATALAAALAELSPAARALLTHVVDHGGEATTGSARLTVLPQDAATPAEELIARRLLVPRVGGSVVHAPGEVGLALRGGRTTVEPIDVVPEVAVAERAPDLVDRAGAGAAFEAVRRVELLLDQWGTHPPTMLRSGGLGVRDLKAAAVHLHLDESATALVVETAHAAGLLGTVANTDGNPVWVPSDAFDAWVAQPPEERWAVLVRAWLDTARLPALVGTRDPAGKTWNALAPELASHAVAEARRAAVAALADLPPGAALAAGTGLPSLLERVSWDRPRRPRSRSDYVAWTVTEGAALGLTGLGAVTTYTRALLADDKPSGLAELMPAPVDHVLIQADLTAVAPGPLESSLARSLQLLADVESRGGATTYRFTASSVRRALDAGWTAAELHDFLAQVSRTPVPQPLTYLVDDTVRTFGAIRVGHAEAFLRADDESSLTELLHHPKAGPLGLRRLAPTVLISTLPIDVLLPRLRELGAAPVMEAADGSVQVSRPDVLRARPPRERRPSLRSVRESARVASVVTAIRAGDRAASARPATSGTPLTPSGALAALREAMEAEATVLIGYVDNQGVSSERVIDPLSIEGGSLTAHDHRADDVRAFAVHRITTVRPLAPG